MLKFGRAIAKHRIAVIVIALLLLIPAVWGMIQTRINYDMLTYLPDDLDTVKGQDILVDKFGKGAYSLILIEGMETKDVSSLKSAVEKVDHVESVIWYDSILDDSVPMEMLPEDVYEKFNADDCTMMAVFFDTSTSSDETITAINEIRSLTGEHCYVSGLSALVADLKSLCEKEEPVYVTIAVLCACAAMVILLDSWLVPFIFLASIGLAIVYNLGTNYFLGEISYITKAIAAVLQLAVTMDYSIFLWHSYSEKKTLYPGDNNEAMANAVADTVTAVAGSSLTTIAGFIALCFMSYKMGMDLGVVMAKGVLLGVIGSVTTLPALILVFDKRLEKTRHRSLIPKMQNFAGFVTKHHVAFLIIAVIILVPALYGYKNTELYYDFTHILTAKDETNLDSEDLRFLAANRKIEEKFNISTTYLALCDSQMPSKDAKAMLSEIESVDGVVDALGADSALGSAFPKEMLPDSLKNALISDDWQLILVNSAYNVSTDESNNQIEKVNEIIKTYDPDGMLIGEAPCTKDLIDVTDKDFGVVDAISIIAVFLIVAAVLKSVSLPFILVAVIEFAIFINLGIPYYTQLALPFIAPVCISTIQLGATVDYAILMTTRYRKERCAGADKTTAVTAALAYAMPSILVSALGFFAATFGVSVYSDVSLISAICDLLARGAIVSMLSVIFVLPSLFMLLDKLIMKTSGGFRNRAGGLASIREE